MFLADVCHLTTKDFTTLEIMQARAFGNDGFMQSILNGKLCRAIVMLQYQIPETIVTVGSLVSYRIDDRPVETRVVANEDYHGLLGLLPVIPISHPHGLAILGVAAGSSVLLQPHEGIAERITVVEVLNQPEAMRRGVRRKGKIGEAAGGKVVPPLDRTLREEIGLVFA